LPDGQSAIVLRKPFTVENRLRVKTHFAKAINMFVAFKAFRENNSLFQNKNQAYVSARPARQEGRYGQSSPDARRDAMDAAAHETNALERTAKSCGPDPPTLGSSLA
jgi:hypothetical protein